MERRQRTWLLILGIMVLLVIPLPSEGREMTAALDLSHAPIFAFMSWVAWNAIRTLRPLRPVSTILMTWAVVLVLGVAAEFLQGLTGRSPSWHDLLANALGSAAFLICVSAPTTAPKRVRFGLFATGAILFVAPSVQPFLLLADSVRQLWQRPRLASFEDALELSRWEFQDCRASRTGDHATHGSWSLRLVMNQGVYPGATLAWPFHDWSMYHDLELDIYLESGPPLDLIVKIEDQEHDGRYEDRFQRLERLAPGPNHVRIPLSEVERAPRGRKLDLSRIRRLQLFTINQPRSVTLFLDNLGLR
jgi:hypothetical protein